MSELKSIQARCQAMIAPLCARGESPIVMLYDEKDDTGQWWRVAEACTSHNSSPPKAVRNNRFVQGAAYTLPSDERTLALATQEAFRLLYEDMRAYGLGLSQL